MSTEFIATARLLALGFSPPDAENVGGVAELSDALGLDGLAAPGDEAATEYERLFAGAAPCAPYEGSYAGDPFQAMRQTADVAGFYRAFGAQTAHQRADHVACELEFLSFLGLRTLAADGEEQEVCREAEDAFLRDHLARWLPALCRRVRDETTLPYYHALADLGERFVDAELARRGLDADPAVRHRPTAVETDCFDCG